ncbi:MAG: ABC transporter ATP-binding protein, partial [Marmoricola sp.]
MSSPAMEARDVPTRADAPYLDVHDLKVHFTTDDGVVKSVDGLSFQLERGKTLGIVGESGSGKSVTSMSIMGLHTASNAAISGSIKLDGEELVGADQDEVRHLRGQKMAMIFQDPLSSMHPFYKVGDQIVEAYRVHNNVSKKVARAHAIEMLDRVGIPEPNQRVDAYPHQFSGGMRQRAMIAMALSCDPALLIADEPTTALDVTVQAQVLDLLAEQQRERFMGMILVTHDLGVVATRADEIAVMYAGKIVEKAPTAVLFRDMKMPYTQALLRAIP